MRRRLVAYLALTFLGLSLSGCGLFKREEREAWRTQAEQACLSAKLVQPTAYMSRLSAIEGPGTCGMDYPFRVTALGGGSVALKQKLTLACPIIPQVDRWLSEVVQPAAQLYFGTRVAEIRAGSYSCRGRNNQRGAKLSEHSFGNAVDVMGFRLEDGREITVAKGWRGAVEEQEFLRETFVGACRFYTTVLGPGADPFHYDHFHLDLARHSARGDRRICKPIIKFTPRLDDPAMLATLARPQAASPLGIPRPIQAPPPASGPVYKGPAPYPAYQPRYPTPAQAAPAGQGAEDDPLAVEEESAAETDYEPNSVAAPAPAARSRSPFNILPNWNGGSIY